MIALQDEGRSVIVLIKNVYCDGRFSYVSHVRCLDTQSVLLLSFVIQRMGQRDLTAEAINAEHAVGVAAVSKVVRQRWVGINIVSRDGRNDSTNF